MKLKMAFKIVSGLSTTKRYSQFSLCNEESVLEHSGAAAMLSMFIADALVKEGAIIDYEKLYKKSILHDVDEFITGDIARPVKYFSNSLRAELRRMEVASVKQISEESGLNFFETWRTAKEEIEGLIVALSDSLCVLYKIQDEMIFRKNFSLIDIASSKLFSHIYELLDEIGLYFSLHINGRIISSLINEVKEIEQRLIKEQIEFWRNK